MTVCPHCQETASPATGTVRGGALWHAPCWDAYKRGEKPRRKEAAPVAAPAPVEEAPAPQVHHLQADDAIAQTPTVDHAPVSEEARREKLRAAAAANRKRKAEAAGT